MLAFQHGTRAEKPFAPQQRRPDARLRGPAGMHPLCPAAFRQIFDDARRHRAGDAQRIGHLLCRQFQRRADGSRRAHRADHRSRMKPGPVDRRRRDQRHAAHQLGPRRDTAKRIRAGEPQPFGGRQDGGKNHRPGMDRRALERVVVILAMGGGAVDQRRTADIHRRRMADRRAGAGLRPGPHHLADIIELAGGDTQTGKSEQRGRGRIADGGRNVPGGQPRSPGAEILGQRGFRQLGRLGHYASRNR